MTLDTQLPASGADSHSGQARGSLQHQPELGKNAVDPGGVIHHLVELFLKCQESELDRSLTSGSQKGAELLKHFEGWAIGLDHPGYASGLTLEAMQAPEQ